MNVIWKKLKAMIAKWFKKKAVEPAQSDTTPADGHGGGEQPQIYNDTSLNLSIRQAGHEVQNQGQVTYLKGVLTTKPLNGWRNVCVQFDHAKNGETTLWKDLTNNKERQDNVSPADVTKIGFVIWCEQ